MRIEFGNREQVERECPLVVKGEVDDRGRAVRQRIYWDTATTGFGLVVGQKARTFVAEWTVKGRAVRIALGRLGEEPTRTLPQARALAQEAVVELRKAHQAQTPQQADGIVAALKARLAGAKAPVRTKVRRDAARFRSAPIPPGSGQPVDPEGWRTVTLRQAIVEHVARMRDDGCSEQSVKLLESTLARHVPDWLDRALVTITNEDCIQARRRIAANSVTHARYAKRAERGLDVPDRSPPGAHLAKRTLHLFRACWNSARIKYPALPEHPVRGIRWGKSLRTHRSEPIPWSELPQWWQAAESIANPIRRDLHLFIMLTGLRKADAGSVRWSDVSFEDGTIHRPNPKGGTAKRFTIPVSGFVLELLERRQRDNGRDLPGDDGGFVFPTMNKAGRVSPILDAAQDDYLRGDDGELVKDERGKPIKVPHPVLRTPHRWRETFSVACLEAGVPHLVSKMLMNHSAPEGKDITAGYQQNLSMEFKRDGTERVTAFLLGKAGVRHAPAQARPLRLATA
jgi:integrase